MNKAHVIKLYPTNSQETLLRKSCGVARYSYNWALTKWQELYKAGEKPSAYTLIKLQNSIKRTEFPFFMEVSKNAPQYAIHNLESAYKKMWRGESKYPKYKKKGRSVDSFVAVENKEQFKQFDLRIHIPRIGKIKCSENLRFEGKVNNVVVKRIANIWFAIINIEVPESTPALKPNEGDNQAIVGIDFGIKSMMVLSDGTVYGNPKALRENMKRMKRLQRSLCRKQKGSGNRRKQQVRVSRLHYRVSCIRKNAIHQATSDIVNRFDRLVIEDLNVAGMMKNGKLAQAIGDVSLYEIRRQLTYKSKWYGKELIVADRFYPSSKLCSCCGHKKDKLKLSERIYRCDNCGLEIDRDLNAARNLASLGSTAKSAGCEACGEGSSALVHSPSVKQELCLTIKNIET